MFERDVVRLQRQQVLPNGHVLCKRAAVRPLLADEGLAEYRIARPKPCHALADGLHDSRHVRAGDRILRLEDPSPHEAKDIRPPGHDMPDIRMDRSRAYPHQDFIIAGRRLVDFSEL